MPEFLGETRNQREVRSRCDFIVAHPTSFLPVAKADFITIITGKWALPRIHDSSPKIWALEF